MTRFQDLVTAGIAATLVIVLAAPLRADETSTRYDPHIRTSSPALQSLIDEAGARSAAFRSLVEEIAASNVIVYVEYRLFALMGSDGRLSFLGAAADRRYVVIQIACPRTRIDQLAILGHEIRHAAEIALAPTVVDRESLRRHYQTIGFVAREWANGVAYETHAAAEFGFRVQREVLASERAEAVAERASRRTGVTAPQ